MVIYPSPFKYTDMRQSEILNQIETVREKLTFSTAMTDPKGYKKAREELVKLEKALARSMKKICAAILVFLLCGILQTSFAQRVLSPDKKATVGYTFVPNLWYTVKQTGPRPYQIDSLQYIEIWADTMGVVKNLINYLDREREERLYAFMLLDALNLDHIAGMVNNKHFNSTLKEYRRILKRNKAIEDSLEKQIYEDRLKLLRQ